MYCCNIGKGKTGRDDVWKKTLYERGRNENRNVKEFRNEFITLISH